MEDEAIVPARHVRKKPFILFRMIQWSVIACFGLTMFLDAGKLAGLDAPSSAYWTAIAALIVISLAHSPQIFFRLRWKAKLSAYAAAVGALVIAGGYGDRLQAEQADATRAVAATIAAAERPQPNSAERCLSGWSGQIPALSEAVKSSLQNPDSFKHVNTALISPDTDGNNVVMTFRAENGFGALRTSRVKAQLNASGCEVRHIQLEQDDSE